MVSPLINYIIKFELCADIGKAVMRKKAVKLANAKFHG
jgi:hypothetical protein